jgi:serine/threonine protein kinase
MELLKGGTLDSLMKSGKRFSELEAANLMQQIFSAL